VIGSIHKNKNIQKKKKKNEVLSKNDYNVK